MVSLCSSAYQLIIERNEGNENTNIYQKQEQKRKGRGKGKRGEGKGEREKGRGKRGEVKKKGIYFSTVKVVTSVLIGIKTIRERTSGYIRA